MNELSKSESNLVDQYLQITCFQQINEKNLKDILAYEPKADLIGKKLINRIKHQVKQGKIMLFSTDPKADDHSSCDKKHNDLFSLRRPTNEDI